MLACSSVDYVCASTFFSKESIGLKTWTRVHLKTKTRLINSLFYKEDIFIYFLIQKFHFQHFILALA